MSSNIHIHSFLDYVETAIRKILGHDKLSDKSEIQLKKSVASVLIAGMNFIGGLL